MPTGAARLGFWWRTPTTEDFFNENFENGLAGWTVIPTRITWGGTMNVGGFPTPVLPDPYLYGCTGDATSVSQSPTYTGIISHDVPPDGGLNSLLLSTDYSGGGGVIDPAGASLFGPAVINNYWVAFNAGDQMQFEWKALAGADAYTLYSYMLRDNGNIIPVLRAAGATPTEGTEWQTQNTVIPVTGNYKFVFVSGSWDATFGTVVSGSMLIDNIKRIPG
jgi:hypothetical protein